MDNNKENNENFSDILKNALNKAGGTRLRFEVLKLANNWDYSAEDVIKRAQTYYEFLMKDERN